MEGGKMKRIEFFMNRKNRVIFILPSIYIQFHRWIYRGDQQTRYMGIGFDFFVWRFGIAFNFKKETNQ